MGQSEPVRLATPLPTYGCCSSIYEYLMPGPDLGRIVLVLPLLAMIVTGCSYYYPIEVLYDDGHLIFSHVRSGIFSDRTVCVNNLTVVATDKTADAEPPGEGMFGAERRVWAIETLPDRWNKCFADLPLRFGVVPKGAVETVKKHRLKLGAVYRVHTSGPGSGGGGSFRLRQILTADNLPDQY